jgi:porin
MRAIGKWAGTLTVAALASAGSIAHSACAWAQAQRSDEKTEPGQTNLSGDWDGLRPYLERKGLVFTLNYTNDFLSNVRGGIRPGTVGIGVFQPQLDLDLQKLVGLQGGHVHIHGLLTHGPFFSQTYLGNILAVSKPGRWGGSIRSGTSTARSAIACLCASA